MASCFYLRNFFAVSLEIVNKKNSYRRLFFKNVSFEVWIELGVSVRPLYL